MDTDRRNDDALPVVGDSVGGYTIERLLGKGGMGAVYLVRAVNGRQYALKVMLPAVDDVHGFRARFVREAEFAMNIRHKNLVHVYATGEDAATGLCYLVMDYMPGGSLADRLAKKRAFPVDEAISIVSKIAAALDVAHLNGVVHRDIKPDNILFAADGTPKLADLGVAKFEERKTTLTTTGMIIGTPAYMAPEQMMDSRNVDGRADIYALGVVLYQMLAGRRPNENDTAVELMAKAIKGEPLPDIRTLRPEVSAAVAYVLSLMCAPKPENRPTTLRDVIGLFRDASSGRLKVPEASPPEASSDETSLQYRVRRGSLFWITASFVVLFVVVAVGMLALSAFRQSSGSQLSPIIITNVMENVTTVTNVVHDYSILEKRAEEYAGMDGQTLLKKYSGIFGEDERSARLIDSYKAMSASERISTIKSLVLCDAIKLMGMDERKVVPALKEIAPRIGHVPLGDLLSAFPSLECTLGSLMESGASTSEINEAIVVFLKDLMPSKGNRDSSGKNAEGGKSPSGGRKTNLEVVEVVPVAQKPAGESASNRGVVPKQSGGRYKIGIAEPVVDSNFSKGDALTIWDELEASFHSPEYTLISRVAFKQMMTEIGLTTSSDLLNMNSSQKAKLGQIEGIKYLVVPSLRKLGTRITLTLKTVESSTGEVDQERSATLKATSLDEISDKLEVTLADMLRSDKNGTKVARSSKKCALLTPVIKFDPAPGYLQGDFNTWMQSALLSKGIQLANLADVSRFQKAGLTEMTDRDYAVLGRELRVACLIQFEITEFAIIDVPWASPETGASGHTYSGRFRARMKVVDANDGSLVDACPVMYDNFLGKTSNGMPPPPVESWAEQMIMKAVMEVIVPRLDQVLQGLKRTN